MNILQTPEQWTLFGEIRGFLSAYARLNSSEQHICSFTFEHLENLGDLTESVTRRFGSENNYSLTLQPGRLDWWLDVRTLLDKWLHHTEEGGGDDRTHSVAFELGKKVSVEEVMDRIKELFSGYRPRFYTLEMEPAEGFMMKPFYETEWDDVVFDLEGRIFLLHLGYSD